MEGQCCHGYSPRWLRQRRNLRAFCLGVLALHWQIFRGTGFPNQFFSDSWVVGFGGADHGWHDIGLERRTRTLAEAVSEPAGAQGTPADVSALRIWADWPRRPQEHSADGGAACGWRL